jgi:hypothetical protein
MTIALGHLFVFLDQPDLMDLLTRLSNILMLHLVKMLADMPCVLRLQKLWPPLQCRNKRAKPCLVLLSVTWNCHLCMQICLTLTLVCFVLLLPGKRSPAQ